MDFKTHKKNIVKRMKIIFRVMQGTSLEYQYDILNGFLWLVT